MRILAPCLGTICPATLSAPCLLTPEEVCSGLDGSTTMERDNLADFATLSERSLGRSAEQGTEDQEECSHLRAATIW